MNWIIVGLLLLFTFTSEVESKDKQYDRSDWVHWIDADKDGVTTRQEVLIDENLIKDSLKMVYTKGNKIKIIKGFWVCLYTGDTITNPRELDIDHLVPLKNAHESGASSWSRKKKREYANYLKDKNHLVAVKASANRQKGAKAPGEWLPDKNQTWYVNAWFHIKNTWHLNVIVRDFPHTTN